MNICEHEGKSSRERQARRAEWSGPDSDHQPRKRWSRTRTDSRLPGAADWTLKAEWCTAQEESLFQLFPYIHFFKGEVISLEKHTKKYEVLLDFEKQNKLGICNLSSPMGSTYSGAYFITEQGHNEMEKQGH